MIITKKLSNICLDFVKNNTSTSEENLEKIYYGIQVLWLTILKSIILFLSAYLLGILEYTLIAFSVFALLRCFACGFHASSSLKCIVINYILFFGNVYLSLNLSTNFIVKTLLFTISFILIARYSPADTEDRPLVSKNLRKSLKLKSIIIIILFYIAVLLIKSDIYANLLTYAILQESLVITPTAYKLFGKEYANYKKY